VGVLDGSKVEVKVEAGVDVGLIVVEGDGAASVGDAGAGGSGVCVWQAASSREIRIMYTQ
jgi:hypothetical protein